MKFNYEKAVQCLNYFARYSKNKEIDKLKALKLVYLADRYHLRKYGRLITNDSYFAMEYGPVASSVKDLTQFNCLSHKEEKYAEKFISPSNKEHHFISRADIEKEVFSETDLEALNFVRENYGHLRDLVGLTHKFPEWKKHETRLKSASRVPMDVYDFLEDTHNLKEEFVILSKNESVIRKEQLKEQEEIEQLLD